MTQKEKYKRAASAMRNALVSIMSDAPDTEYRMRAARDEIRRRCRMRIATTGG